MTSTAPDPLEPQSPRPHCRKRRRLSGLRGRRGASAIEYCLLLSVVAVVAIAGVQHLGGSLRSVFRGIAGHLQAPAPADAPPDGKPDKRPKGPGDRGKGKGGPLGAPGAPWNS